MSTPDIRAAAPEDLDDLAGLNAQVQALHVRLQPSRFRADPAPSELRAHLRDVLARSDHRIWVGCADGRARGYIWFELQERAPTPYVQALRRLYVHHICVDASARRQGVARALMRRVEAEAATRSMSEIALDVWSANREALAFFQSTGYAASRVVLAKAL